VIPLRETRRQTPQSETKVTYNLKERGYYIVKGKGKTPKEVQDV